MTQKDTATIREVYNLVSQMRQEMKDMKSELKFDFKSTMDSHCEWAKETVAHYEVVAQEYGMRINKTESFIDNMTGKIAVIGAVVGILTTVAFDLVKDIFAKGR